MPAKASRFFAEYAEGVVRRVDDVDSALIDVISLDVAVHHEGDRHASVEIHDRHAVIGLWRSPDVVVGTERTSDLFGEELSQPG